MPAKKSAKASDEITEKPIEKPQSEVDELKSQLATKDEKIAVLTKTLIWVRENIVSGNSAHVETINRIIS